MGVGYYVSLVQWSKGEYANANQTQDDLAIITSSTYGVGYRTDDYGNTTAAATSLTINAGSVNNAGIIERTGDVDMFAFSTTGGNLNLTFTSNAAYPDLDILATLYDNNGMVITTSNPSGLNASISSTLAAGNYYVSVTGTGSGNPVTTGYSSYGSLGTYTITGSITGGGSTPTGIAIFYKDCNYTGAFAVGLNEGTYTKAQLIAKGITDKDISSIKITPGYEVVLYKNDNLSGTAAGYTTDVSCLVSSGWNDSTTSLRIRSVINKLPTISITSPVNGNTFTAPAGIVINATASDADGAIAKVEFYNGSTKLGEDGSSPYSFTWSNVGAGTYTIKAVATDDRGGQSTAQLNVVVNNPPGAIVYKNCNYDGYAINLPAGSYTLNQLIALGVINDDISSLKVNGGYEVILYRDNNFTGPAYLFRSNASCLVSVGLSGGSTVNLNDWTTSIVVRQTTAMASLAADGNNVVPFIDYAASMRLLPNPVHNEMVIQYGNMGDHFDVTIVDANGAVVFTQPHILSGQLINIMNLRPGFYFVKINTGKETITRKLIKR
jgi:hypothetical protein